MTTPEFSAVEFTVRKANRTQGGCLHTVGNCVERFSYGPAQCVAYDKQIFFIFTVVVKKAKWSLSPPPPNRINRFGLRTMPAFEPVVLFVSKHFIPSQCVHNLARFWNLIVQIRMGMYVRYDIGSTITFCQEYLSRILR